MPALSFLFAKRAIITIDPERDESNTGEERYLSDSQPKEMLAVQALMKINFTSPNKMSSVLTIRCNFPQIPLPPGQI